MIDWKEGYKIGIKDMDEPREFLTEKLNCFLAKISKKIKSEYIEDLNQLIDGFRMYFSKEEQMLAKVKFPELDEHKSYHRDYLRKLIRLRRQMSDETLTPIKDDFFVLASLYAEHMLINDLEFAPFIRLKRMIESHSIKK